MSKNIFVIGGVLSSLGKGIAASSIGFLLKRMGFSVGMQKLDPYINVDPGTMSPFQHGEVFVTDDGYEADLDLGHYERFIGEPTSRNSNATTGQIYERVIQKERAGEYLGKTVQVIPHITDEIKSLIKSMNSDYDFVITEIGGTVGDIESLPFIEALRQFRLEKGFSNSMFVFLTYVPYVKAAGELKTKPTQHSVNKLREIGIQPDLLLCRSEEKLDEDTINKIALFTNVSPKKVINAIDLPTIYEVPINFYNAGLHERVLDHFQISTADTRIDFKGWNELINNIKNPSQEVNIAVCGKYVEHKDAYKSVDSALIHAAAANKVKLNINWVDSEAIESIEQAKKELESSDAILVPGGFGTRGIEGKVLIAQYARENNVPYFGICLGMQIAVIEFMRNVCGLEGANSGEFTPDNKYKVIDLMEEQKKFMKNLGGTMRLGAYDCKLVDETLAKNIYADELISERHRHRYEFNNEYRTKAEENGMKISGTSPDNMLVEIVEIPNHRFYIGVQYHPEFKSRPTNAHPIFREFVKAALKVRLEKTTIV